MTFEAPQSDKTTPQPVYSREDLHADDRLDQGVYSVFERGAAEVGAWPEQVSAEKMVVQGIRHSKPRRKPTPSKVIDGDSGLDPHWNVSQGESRTPEEAQIAQDAMESFRARAEALERQRLVDAGENADAILRARAMRKSRGPLA